jgi:hypothetical protein
MHINIIYYVFIVMVWCWYFLLIYQCLSLCLALECPEGWYDTTYDTCDECKYLRNQYWTENCCAMTNVITMPAQVEEIPTYSGHAFRIKYNPPRPICKYLMEQWGNCTVCQNYPPGHYCSMDIDCNNTYSCKGFCCIASDDKCATCETGTGYCTSCAFETVFNATGNLTCQRCPDNTYMDVICNPVTDCQPGTYVSTYPTYTADRGCSNAPNGYYTTEINTNPLDLIPWDTCNISIYYTIEGNTTHNVTCVNRTDCLLGEYIIDDGNITTDRTCENCTAGTTTEINLYICT